MQLIPYLPFHLNSIALFALVLLLGLIGGELASRSRIFPSVTGYIAVGFMFGPGGLNILNEEVLMNTRFFVDVSLSLILFELGRYFDFSWLRQDRGLLATGLTESAFTFVLVFALLDFVVGMSWLASSLGATIAVATSPAVIMTVAFDLRSSGPVTRRALILTGMNNLIALTIFIFLLPITQIKGISDYTWLLYAAYRYFASIALGFVMFFVFAVVARFTGKKIENQFVLFVAMVVLTLGLATTFDLSNMLSLFMLGVAARNLDVRHVLMEVDFSWIARIFFILLFVVIGIHLQLQGLWDATFAVVAYIVVRYIAKTAAIMLYYRQSRLTVLQASSLSLALVPIGGIAIGMSNVLIDINPEYGNQFLTFIAAVVAVLSIIGPVLTRIAFVRTGEASTECD